MRNELKYIINRPIIMETEWW